MNSFNDFPPPLPARRHGHRPRRGDRCIALVDARFMEWLAGEEGAPSHRDRLGALLDAALAAADLPGEIVRIHWYTAQADAQPVGGQVLRWVAPEGTDAGASLALTMARDLAALAEHGACDLVLLATDDDRLLTAVDAAQMRGLRVHLLADDSAVDLSALSRNDGAWAALLRQADARVIVTGAEVERALWGDGEVSVSEHAPRAPRHSEGGPHRPQRQHRSAERGERPDIDTTAIREGLGPMVSAWWGELPAEEQLALHARLPPHRGLPQEADRALLVRLSQQLGRPLSLDEKRVMRDLARQAVMRDSGLPPEDEFEGGDDASPRDPERAEA
jgi:hypothetical protein